MANEYIRKQSKGGAVQTTLNGAITNVSATIVIANATGWPDGSIPFVVTIDRNQASEETILVTRAVASTTLVVVNRGYDNTLAQSHSNGAAIIHSYDAHSADQANRLANLLLAKGAIIIHNGVNPIEFDPGFAGDGSDDMYVLLADDGEETGWRFGVLPPVVQNPSAPNVATTRYALWYDETLNLFRPSDGAEWVMPNQAPVFNTKALRAAAIASPRAGQLAIIQSGNVVALEKYNGATWQPVGLPLFADTAQRTAYYDGTSGVSLYEGAKALTLDTNEQWSYRASEAEWILQGQKITVSDIQPSSPRDGDVWAQPIS